MERTKPTNEVTGADRISGGGFQTVAAEGEAVAAAEQGGAAVATQTQEPVAKVVAAATQTVVAAELTAVATQTAAAEQARVGAQARGKERSSMNEEAESDDCCGRGGSGSGDDCAGGICNDSEDGGGESSGVVTDTTAETSNDASAGREEGGEGSAVNEAGNGKDTADPEKNVRSTAILEAENARLAEELAEALARLEQLRAQAQAPAAPQGGKADDATARASGTDDGGDRTRSYSDVVVRGNAGTAAPATAAAGRDERGSGRSRGSGSRRGSSSSSSSSKEATQNQLAAYRAGLSMLVKLTDQQRSAVAAAGAAASSSAGNPAGENAEESTAVAMAAGPPVETTSAAAAAAADEEAAVVTSSPSSTHVVPDNHQQRRDGGDLSSSPTTAQYETGLACTEDVQGGGDDVPTAPGTTLSGADTVPSAPEVAVAVEGGRESGVGSEPVAAVAATTACGGGDDRQGQAGAAAEKESVPTSPVSPNRQKVPSPGGSPAGAAATATVAPAAGVVDGVAGPGATGAVAVRPATLRIKRAADYVATHLRHNHVSFFFFVSVIFRCWAFCCGDISRLVESLAREGWASKLHIR